MDGYCLRAMKERRQLRHFFLAVVLLFSSTAYLTCNAMNDTDDHYQLEQLNALQAIWEEWSTNTPHLESNLAGWNSSQDFPCSEDIQRRGKPVRFYKRWRGVQCLRNINCDSNATTGDKMCDVYITSLALKNASIVGTLPPDIGNISTLTTLELSRNPNLTGPLPATLLDNTNLYTLDLHGNAFYGAILDLGSFKYLQNVNLGGNRFIGSFPILPRSSSDDYLQTLNLGRNDLQGTIPGNAFENMTQLVELDLSSNRFNGTLPTLTMFKNLQILNAFEGSILSSSASDNLTDSNSLSVLDLSHNRLTSAMNSWNISELGSLQELYLDHNLINGTLNISLLSALGLLSKKSSDSTASSGLLRVLSLRNNSIRSVVYDAKMELITTVFRLQGNPYCDFNDGSTFNQQACFNSVPTNNDKRKIVLIAVVTSAISVLLMIALAVTLYNYRRYKQYSQLVMQRKFEEFEVKPTIFPYNQLRTATRDFHLDMKLGQGAFGAVYKGIFPNGKVMAVKQLFAKTNQGIDEFLNEVVLLTGMKHRNLVNLKGCCIREQENLLVYEYVDNYDVDKVLLAGPNKYLVSWPVRLKICLGVARGLHYLHALAQPRIIHRDIKASNILLAKNHESKIADFGLASLFPDEESYIMTKHVAGTKGYLAPEYASFGQLSDKVDVFSFGVLCLEIVSGRRNIDETMPPQEMYLSKWAWELLRRDSLMVLVDRTMSLQDEEKLEVHRLINIALLCIQNEAEQRPSMERVVAMLQGDSESETVALNPGNEEQYLESIRLFAVGRSDLATVKEEEPLSFVNSLSRRGGGLSEDNVSTGAVLELSEIRVR